MAKNKSNTKKCRVFCVIYYWLKIIGINPLSLSKTNKLVFSYLGLIYGCSLATLFSCLAYYVLVERLTLLLPGETPLTGIVVFMTMTINILEILSTWLLFGFHQNRMKDIVKRFFRAEEISTQLDIPENYEKNLRELGINLTVVTTLYFAWGTLVHTFIRSYIHFRILMWMSYFFSRVATFNSGALYIWSLIIVKRKFYRLNDKLRFVLQNRITRTNEMEDCNSTLLTDNRLNMISQLHRELRDTVHCIQQHCALIIFFNFLGLLFGITLNIHLVSLYLRHQDPKEIDFFDLVCMCSWIVVPVIMLIIISSVCDSTTKEANMTGNILHTSISSGGDFDYTRHDAILKIISLDLLQNQVRLSLFGFFDMDSSLVYNTLTTVATYLMIMLQFYC